MTFALANLNDPSQEGGYTVWHGRAPLDDFGETVTGQGGCNPFAATFPVLFLHGVGSIEALKSVWRSMPDGPCNTMVVALPCTTRSHSSCLPLSKKEAMCPAWLKMQRNGFEWDALADLKKAELEEGLKEPISPCSIATLSEVVGDQDIWWSYKIVTFRKGWAAPAPTTFAFDEIIGKWKQLYTHTYLCIDHNASCNSSSVVSVVASALPLHPTFGIKLC